MTVSGVAAVSVIAGQEQFRQQEKLRRTSQNPAMHLEAPDQTAAPGDTVTLKRNSQQQSTDTFNFTRHLQPENLRAIAAYEAIQPGLRLEHLPEIVAGDQPVPQEPSAQMSVDIRS